MSSLSLSSLCALPLPSFVTFIGGSVGNEFYGRKFPYEMGTKHKVHMTILNVQVNTDVASWIVYSLMFRISIVCLERKRVNILTNGLSGRFA